MPASQEGVELGEAARKTSYPVLGAMLGGHEARKHLEAPRSNGVVVQAAAVALAANLENLQAAALAAEFRELLLQPKDAVGDALDLQVVIGGQVVENEHRAIATAEELLEREDLAAEAQRVAREEPQFRERVENHARGLEPLDVLEE
jgi:hypothetical protein